MICLNRRDCVRLLRDGSAVHGIVARQLAHARLFDALQRHLFILHRCGLGVRAASQHHDKGTEDLDYSCWLLSAKNERIFGDGRYLMVSAPYLLNVTLGELVAESDKSEVYAFQRAILTTEL